MVSVWNTPQGTPHRISAASKALTLCAVKKIAVKAAIRTKQAITVWTNVRVEGGGEEEKTYISVSKAFGDEAIYE